jgi:hypothetical protein
MPAQERWNQSVHAAPDRRQHQRADIMFGEKAADVIKAELRVI